MLFLPTLALLAQVSNVFAQSEPPLPVDNVDYKSITCTDSIIQSHTTHGYSDQWRGVGVVAAFQDVVKNYQSNIESGRPAIDFANNASDLFHGPNGMYCENLATSSGCSSFNLQCHDVTYPAGYFMLNSFSRLHDFNMDLLTGLRDAQMGNNITVIQQTFGLPDKSELKTAIIIDIILMAWGAIMGPMWPRLGSGAGFSQIKDTTNDIFKASMALTKDLSAKIDGQLGQQSAMQDKMKLVAGVMTDVVVALNNELFSGSESGNKLLYGHIDDGAMMAEGWRKAPGDFSRPFVRVMDAFLIQEAWRTSERNLYPFIIRDDKIRCDEQSANVRLEYMSKWAHDNVRFCGPGGVSYWLVAHRKWSETCQKNSDVVVDCSPADSLPGFEALRDRKIMDISYEDVIMGSLASYEKNGNKNGFKGMNLDDSAQSKEFLSLVMDSNVRAPGLWNYPICSGEEAIFTFNKAMYNSDNIKDWSVFPCGIPWE